MHDFIRHSFSPTENLPPLQFTLDNLAQGKSVAIAINDADFEPLFCAISLGVCANILSNGAKVAILSDDANLRANLVKNAQQQNWGELFLPFQSQHLSEYLAQIQQKKQHSQLKFPLPTNSMRVLQLCAAQIQQHKQAVEKWLAFRHKDKTYPELVAEYLQQYGKNPPLAKIDGLNHQFAGNGQQLQILLAKLQEAELLYQQLGDFQHPLNVLNDRFFRQNDLQLAQETAAETLEKVAFVVDAANRDAFTYLFKYEKWIEDHYTEVFAHQNALIDQLLQLCAQGQKLGKFVHDEKKSLSERVGGFFKSITGKSKSLSNIQQEVKAVYTELHQFQQAHNYVPHKFLSLQQENLTFAQVGENISSYSQHLSEWFGQKELLVRAYSKRLSRYEVHPHSNYLGFVHQFLTDLDVFAEKLNWAKLLKINFVFHSENVSERVKQLEVLQKNIQNLRDHWADFSDYFNLKFFWLTLSESEKELISTLAELGITNWAHSFESNLTAQQIAAAETHTIPQKIAYEKQFSELSRNLQQAKSELSKFIAPHWKGLYSEFNPQKLATVENTTDFCHFTAYFPSFCTDWEEMANLPAGVFQLIIADIRGKSADFYPNISQKSPLVVWISDKEDNFEPIKSPNTEIWCEQPRFYPDQGKQPFYEWLAQQLKSQNAAIEPILGAETAHFGGKIPLLLKTPSKQVAIFADFFTYSDWKNAYLWELYTQQRLKSAGIIYYKTYTSAWRENPLAELTHLLATCR